MSVPQFGSDRKSVLFAAGQQWIHVVGQSKFAWLCYVEMMLAHNHGDVVLVGEYAGVQFDCSKKWQAFLERTKIVQTKVDLIQVRIVEAQVELIGQLVVD